MLGGIAPILIVRIKPKPTTVKTKIKTSNPTVLQTIKDKIGIPIPIYLDRNLTGLVIASEVKNISVSTDMNTPSEGGVVVNQNALGSTTTITMMASSGSIGITLLSALLDMLLEKVSSKDYDLTYLSGASTIIGGVFHEFNIEQTNENDMFKITLTLSRGGKKPDKNLDRKSNDNLNGKKGVGAVTNKTFEGNVPKPLSQQPPEIRMR